MNEPKSKLSNCIQQDTFKQITRAEEPQEYTMYNEILVK